MTPRVWSPSAAREVARRVAREEIDRGKSWGEVKWLLSSVEQALAGDDPEHHYFCAISFYTVGRETDARKELGR